MYPDNNRYDTEHRKGARIDHETLYKVAYISEMPLDNRPSDTVLDIYDSHMVKADRKVIRKKILFGNKE